MSLPPFNTSPSFTLTRNPDENWAFGDGLREQTELGAKWKEDESKGWKSITLDEIEKPLVYKLLISAVTPRRNIIAYRHREVFLVRTEMLLFLPRPIAFVATLSEDGVQNLAPFSYFSLVSHNPPLVSISFTLPSKGVKDTRENIKATKEFTVNIISEPFVEAANATSIDAPPEVDEFVMSGLTPLPSDIVKPPRVRESAISFECELFHFIDISPSGVTASSHLPPPTSSSSSQDTPAAPTTNTLVLGRIVRAHIRRSVLSSSSSSPSSPSSSSSSSSASDGETTVDPAALRPVARLGGTTYARIGEGFDLPRPSWKAEGGQVGDLLDRKVQVQAEQEQEQERESGESGSGIGRL
ncbi:hypothetical protein ACEPAG_8338 [Sanghuangporus baumii]